MEETERLNLCVSSMSGVFLVWSAPLYVRRIICKVYYSWVDKAQAWSLALVEPSESFCAANASLMSSRPEALQRRHARLT